MFKRTSTPARNTNISDDINNLLIKGQYMNDNEFEKFIKIHAKECYWKILAERARIELEDQLRENRQLHELLNELMKENEQLQIKNEQCEYLTNIFNSVLSEHDSGVELNMTDESPESKRRKKVHI